MAKSASSAFPIDGFLPLMALVNPHPALKVAVPMNPMVDGWMGDDWFHNGAFREQGMPYIYEQEATRRSDVKWWKSYFDDYDMFMQAGSAGELGRLHGLEQVGFWRKILEHPSYDAYWRDQAVDRLLAAEPLKVPVLLVHSLWDQEDIYGAIAVYKAIKPKDTNHDKVFLVLGPWYHAQEIGDGSTLGPLKFGSDTALYFRREILRPCCHFAGRYVCDACQEPCGGISLSDVGKNGGNRHSRWLCDLCIRGKQRKTRTPEQRQAVIDRLAAARRDRTTVRIQAKEGVEIRNAVAVVTADANPLKEVYGIM